MVNKLKYYAALKISLLFLFISSAYIIFSDYLVLNLLEGSVSPESLSTVQSYKGLAYVFVASVLLFYLIQREIKIQFDYVSDLDEQKNRFQKLSEEKEKVGKELIDRNTFIETILKNLPIGIAINKIDDSNAVFLNAKFSEIYGWPEEELKNTETFFKNVYPKKEYRDKIKKQVLNDIESGDPARMQWEGVKITTSDDEIRYVNANNIPINEQNFMISTVMDVSNHYKSEQKLRESEKRYRAIFENSLTAIVVADDSGRFIELNKAAENIFGYSKNELLKMKVSDLSTSAPKNTEVQYKEYLQKNQDKGEFDFKDKNGDEHTVLYHAVRIDKDFNLSLMMDITLRKKIVEKLSESESKFSSLFKLNPTAIVFTRFADGVILEVNDAYCNMFGYSQKELLNHATTKISIWKNEKDRDTMLKVLLEKKAVHGFETEAVHKNGILIDTLSYLQIVEITGEKAIIGIILDITEKKRNERDLKESKALLEKTINSLSEAVLVIDPEGRYVRLANKAVKHIFGYEPNAIIGEQTDILHVNQDRFREFGKIGNPILEKTGVFHTTFQMKHKSGKTIETENTVTAIHEEGGWRSGVVSVVRDITEKKQTEKKLQKYQESLKQLTMELSLAEEKQRKEIAANIHDHLSQLLVISKMKLGDLNTRLNSNETKKELNSIIKHINEALENSRNITYDLSPPILYELGLVETMYWLRDKINEEQHIEVNFKTNTEEIDLPENKLILTYRIIQELVNNTLKHSAADKLNIIFEKQIKHLEIELTDNGRGFESKPNTDISFHRSGFGLFAVKERINNLGGSFSIDSKPKIGTSVKFSVPLNF